MSRLPRGSRRALLLRSFVVQGSWNYETLIGTGFAFVLLPVLRHVYRGDPDALRAAVERHSDVFNSHPYLVTIAAGAVARLEADRASPEVTARFKNALRGSLGSLGDQLVWLSWRPACALLAIVLLLLGLPWWVAVVSFLLCYNALHLWLRVWGLRLGLLNGLRVGRTLRDAPLAALSRRAADAGVVLAGVGTALAVGATGPDPVGIAAGSVAAVAGIAAGLRIRRPAYVVLLVVWMVGIVLGFTS